jgi:glyoxylase-like metal-dependent hydrolase (beta-lactamase superfamily II)
MARTPAHRAPNDFARRSFSQAAAVAVMLMLGACLFGSDLPTAGAAESSRPAEAKQLSEHLWVYQGPINVGVIRDGEKALLIDCGDGSVSSVLPDLGVTKVEQILFTHHHRDQACGVYRFVDQGAKIGVPKDERDHFADPGSFWNDDGNIWRVYQSFRPHRLMLTRPVPVENALADGDEIRFGPARIRARGTPGHTEGALSYLVEVDGKRVVFSGDCIYDEGQVWDLYSLQKGFSQGGQQIGGYHGFMGDRRQLVESLGRIKEWQPDLLVPSHGRVMSDPAKAIDTLVERFEKCYENYVAISALRHYFPKLFTEYAGRPGQMPIRPGIKPPDCLRHFGTTWMVVSKTGAAFVMDVGSQGIVDRLKKMLKEKEIKSVDGLWVTHYHFDHTDGIPLFQREFDCPCYADRRLADVLTRPAAWYLPCLAKEPIRVDHPTEDGQSWEWHEFKLTAYDYPGQTLYHDALLVERGDLRMLFVGDSHTPSGIDDYCAYNRNWLGRDVGFQYCISLIERLKPTHVFNCHVDDAFTFTPEEIRFMRENLDKRERLFGELVPWDHANYGMDPSWVRCDPYTQRAAPGARLKLGIVITNHSSRPHRVLCRPAWPDAFARAGAASTATEVPAKTEKRLAVEFRAPEAPGRYVLPIDIDYGPWKLPQFAEAIVDVSNE